MPNAAPFEIAPNDATASTVPVRVQKKASSFAQIEKEGGYASRHGMKKRLSWVRSHHVRSTQPLLHSL